MAPCRIRLTSHDNHRAALCPNRDGGFGHNMASKHFEDYLIGLPFHIATDHKPLVPLLSTTILGDLPARVQRMRMMRFTYTISDVPGIHLYTAETMSRAPLVRPLNQIEEKLESDVKAYVDLVVRYLTVTEM